MPPPEKRQASNEIEITPEMIEAGILILLEYDPDFSNENDIVAKMFKSMLEAASP